MFLKSIANFLNVIIVSLQWFIGAKFGTQSSLTSALEQLTEVNQLISGVELQVAPFYKNIEWSTKIASSGSCLFRRAFKIDRELGRACIVTKE